MPTVNYIESDGTKHTVELKEGTTLMQGAVSNGVDGIDAICGGCCACATCHCFIDPAWYEQLEAASAEETELLEFLDFHEPGQSRLACQVIITDQLDGLLLTVSPEE